MLRLLMILSLLVLSGCLAANGPVTGVGYYPPGSDMLTQKGGGDPYLAWQRGF